MHVISLRFDNQQYDQHVLRHQQVWEFIHGPVGRRGRYCRFPGLSFGLPGRKDIIYDRCNRGWV